MSTYIDKMFINIISSKLQKFAWKKDNLANCRCPICGDSTKHKNKARGFFFQKNKKSAICTITPEFGPFPYMPQEPFTKKPLSNQWEINLQMKNYLQQNL